MSPLSVPVAILLDKAGGSLAVKKGLVRNIALIILEKAKNDYEVRPLGTPFEFKEVYDVYYPAYLSTQNGNLW